LLNLLNNTDDKLEPLSYEQRVENLKTYVQLLKKINAAKGNINYNLEESPKLK